MKKLFTLASILFVANAMAQTFTNNTGGAIPDSPAPEVCFDLTVSGLPNAANTSWGVTTACIDITHTWDGDLRITLRSPLGFEAILSNTRGGDGDNFTATCFREDAEDGYVANGFAPFTGTFIPDQSLNAYNIGMNPNGTWQLCVQDLAGADVGTVNSFSITFGANPPADPLPPPGPCGLANAGNCLCPDGSDTCDLIPDMTASASIIEAEHTEYVGYMRLSNATPNIGWGPMEIHGVDSCFCGTQPVPCSTTQCPDLSYPKQRIHQTIYRREGNTMSSYTRSAGTMTYHPSHGHVHVDDWAQFSVRRDNGDPNPLNWDMIAEGEKVSFCLINLGDCSNNYGWCIDQENGDTLTMADIPNAPFGVVSGCGNDQGIYTGNLDIYSQGLEGMDIQFPVDICNGDYYVVSTTDPNNNFLETNENNNTVVAPITLTQQTEPTPPVAQFSYSVSGTTVHFFNTPDVNGIFNWDFGDGTTSSAQNPTHVYPVDGNYDVTLYVTNHCSGDVDSVTYDVNIFTTGIDSYEQRTSLLAAYPNPYRNATTIAYFADGKNPVVLEVFNIVGERVATLVNGIQSVGSHELNFSAKGSGMSAGVYMVRLLSNERSVTLKITEME